MADYFNENASRTYDQKNRGLSPIADNMHFLIKLILNDLPADSKILCVGVGTGAEILSLASEHPQWKFVGVDPSAAMLQVCRERMEDAGIQDRCEYIHGYVHDVPAGEHFDAVLSILVGHFVQKEERQSFYTHMHDRLKKGGYLIDTEISYDLDADTFPSMLKSWEKVQMLMGANKDSLAALPNALRNVLAVLPPAAVEDHIRGTGIADPIRFFQAFMITGWYGTKD